MKIFKKLGKKIVLYSWKGYKGAYKRRNNKSWYRNHNGKYCRWYAIAPLFYGMIGGAPLAMMYKGVNTMDSMLGYMNDKYIHLGFFSS